MEGPGSWFWRCSGALVSHPIPSVVGADSFSVLYTVNSPSDSKGSRKSASSKGELFARAVCQSCLPSPVPGASFGIGAKSSEVG